MGDEDGTEKEMSWDLPGRVELARAREAGQERACLSRTYVEDLNNIEGSQRRGTYGHSVTNLPITSPCVANMNRQNSNGRVRRFQRCAGNAAAKVQGSHFK